MSGICGVAFTGNNYKVPEAALSQMVKQLEFDAQSRPSIGAYGPVGFGVRTFSTNVAGVVGTSHGGDRLALAFYGSLFNLPELFPHSEVQNGDLIASMLQWYENDGVQLLSRLQGEFVLALWDGRVDTLYLACDRFRIHPLFYYQDHEKLVFSSRMKGIVNGPFVVNLSVNHAAIIDVVVNSFVPTPQSIFQEVKKLPPGHVLRYRRGELHVEPYWHLSFLDQSQEPESSLAKTLRAVFSDSVASRLSVDDFQDEEVGAFLSGGVDSTTVVGVLTQLTKNPIKTFSIGFSEEQYNEIEYARTAARAFGADHHEYFVSSHDVFEMVDMIIETFDEPFGNASSIPTFFCAKLAKEHGVKVLFAGDGGDELFAGNERYAKQQIFQRYYLFPPWLRKIIVEPLVFSLAEYTNLEIFKKGKKYIERAHVPFPDRLFAYNLFESIPKKTLFETQFLEMIGKNYDPFDSFRCHYSDALANTELERQLYMDLKLAISDNDLFKVTRMTERAGIKVQFPFLDYRLSDFAAAIPDRIKMRGGELRSFFKGAYGDLLPTSTRKKEKHGFGLPIPVWLRTDARLNEMMCDLVLGPTAMQRGYYQKKTLEMLVEQHRTDPTGFYGTILWNLMILEAWHRGSSV